MKLLEQLRDARRKAEDRDRTSKALACEAFDHIKDEALAIAGGTGPNRSYGQFEVTFTGSRGGNEHLLRKVADELATLLQYNHIIGHFSKDGRTVQIHW